MQILTLHFCYVFEYVWFCQNILCISVFMYILSNAFNFIFCWSGDHLCVCIVIIHTILCVKIKYLHWEFNGWINYMHTVCCWNCTSWVYWHNTISMIPTYDKHILYDIVSCWFCIWRHRLWYWGFFYKVKNPDQCIISIA